MKKINVDGNFVFAVLCLVMGTIYLINGARLWALFCLVGSVVNYFAWKLN